MRKKWDIRKGKTMERLCLLCFFTLVFIAHPLWAQTPEPMDEKAGTREEIIETQLSFDQALIEQERPEEIQQRARAAARSSLSFDEQQIMRINESLKNVIEENENLSKDREDLEKELGRLRGQKEIRVNRIGALSRQRDNLSGRISALEKLQKDFEAQIKKFEETLKEKEAEFEKTIADMKQKKMIEEQERQATMERVLPTLKDKKYTTEAKKQQKQMHQEAKQMLREVERSARRAGARIADLSRENKQLVKETAKLHYNAGNIFFEKADYKRAAVEYKKVVDFMPYDAAAHYNLAFVSGEFLDDRETALKHYQFYLYLEPDAEDAYLIDEKILEIQLAMEARVRSPVDKPYSFPGPINK